jgi:MFS family permease
MVGNRKYRQLLALLIGALLSATAYGSTFLLVDLLAAQGFPKAMIGPTSLMIAIGAVASAYCSGAAQAKIGLRQTLQLAALCLAIGLAVLAYAPGSLSSRVGAGMLGVGWGCFFTLAPVMVTRILDETERTKGFMHLAAAFSIGFGLTPAILKILMDTAIGLAGGFGINALACLISIFALNYIEVDNEYYSSARLTELNCLQDEQIKLLSIFGIAPTLIVGLGAFLFSGINTFQSLYAHTLGWNYGSYFAVNTIAAVGGRILHSLYCPLKTGPQFICGLYIGTAFALATYLFNTQSEILYLLAAFAFGIGYGVSYPLIMGLVADDAPFGRTGQCIRNAGAIYFLCLFGAPFILAPIVEMHGIRAIYGPLTAVFVLKFALLSAYGIHTSLNKSHKLSGGLRVPSDKT